MGVCLGHSLDRKSAKIEVATEDVVHHYLFKEVILKCYNISKETHQCKFHAWIQGKGESYLELARA